MFQKQTFDMLDVFYVYIFFFVFRLLWNPTVCSGSEGLVVNKSFSHGNCPRNILEDVKDKLI